MLRTVLLRTVLLRTVLLGSVPLILQDLACGYITGIVSSAEFCYLCVLLLPVQKQLSELGPPPDEDPPDAPMDVAHVLVSNMSSKCS